MGTGVSPEVTANTDRFYTMVKSLNNFDKQEVKTVIDGLLSRTDEDNCYIGTYLRGKANAETILLIQNAAHFQAASMLARSLFELGVDMRLLEVTPGGWIKVIAFIEEEKLRSARKVMAFRQAHPEADVDVVVFESYIAHQAGRVDALRKTLWPNTKRVEHWSGMNLAQRVALLKSPFDRIYAVEYPTLSWHVHSGMTAVMGLKAETFTLLCGCAFRLAAESYSEILSTVIRHFNLDKADEKIEKKLNVAKLLPFADTPDTS